MSSSESATTVATPTAANTGGAPSSGEKTGAQDTGFRYTPGPGVDDWAVGKTAQEMYQLTKELLGVVKGGQMSAAQPPPPPPQPFQPPTNDDWMTNPQEAFQRGLKVVQDQQFTPYIQQMAQANAATSRALAEQRYADDFKRWGPEIAIELSKVPVEMQTFDNIRYVVDFVRGRHANELANELAEQRIQERLASGTLRPIGDGGGGVAPSPADGLDFTQLPDGYQAILDRAGVKSIGVLDRFLRKYYGEDVDLAEARKNWFELAGKGNVVVESIKGAGYRREL